MARISSLVNSFIGKHCYAAPDSIEAAKMPGAVWI